jgi:hypothetical protein
MEADMKGLMVFFKVAAVGFALLAGGRAIYQNRDKLKGDWRSLGKSGRLKGLAGKFSANRLVGSAGSLKSLVGQVARFR